MKIIEIQDPFDNRNFSQNKKIETKNTRNHWMK